MVPSWPFATQISLPSGEISKPSEPLPTLTTVSFQSSRGGPAGGADEPACCEFTGVPGPEGGAAFGPALGERTPALSMMLTVPELTLLTMMRLRFGAT